jgi:hypothetical protein
VLGIFIDWGHLSFQRNPYHTRNFGTPLPLVIASLSLGLKAACTALVNDHDLLPLTQLWGSGILSSPDGQRFPVSGQTLQARPVPRPLGKGCGGAV